MAPEDNPADDVQITREEWNRFNALRDLRGHVKEMRRHAVGARKAASHAMSELEEILSCLPGTDEAVEAADEEELISCLAAILPWSFKRYADGLDDLDSDLKRAVKNHLKAAGEADSLRSYITAGDFSE